MFSAVVAVRLRERLAATTAYTASLELSRVTRAISFNLWRFDAAFPSQPIVEGPGEAGSGSAAISMKSILWEYGADIAWFAGTFSSKRRKWPNKHHRMSIALI